MKIFLSHILMPLILFSQSSCFNHYYQTNTTRTVSSDMLAKLCEAKKIFIVHTTDSIFGLKEVSVVNNELTGKRDSLKRNFQQYLHPVSQMANPVPLSQLEVVTEEVHLYTRNASILIERLNLPVSQIERMDVYGLDERATRRSLIIGITILTIVATASAALVIGFVEVMSAIS